MNVMLTQIFLCDLKPLGSYSTAYELLDKSLIETTNQKDLSFLEVRETLYM